MGSVVRLREVPQRHTPVRRPNHELRTREHLTEREVEKLIEAAKGRTVPTVQSLKHPEAGVPSGPVPRLGERLTAKRASALLLRTRSNANQAWEEGLEAAEDTRRPLRLWEA